MIDKSTTRNPTPQETSPVSPTRPLLLAILVGLYILVFWPVWKGLVHAWLSQEDLSHGFLIPPVFLFILWSRRETLASLSSAPSNWGLVWVLLSLVTYVLSFYAGIRTVACLSMVLALAGAVLFLFGCRLLKELLFPIVILCLMIPVPAQIYSAMTTPLQLGVSKMSVAVLGWSGIPVLREGNVIHLSDRTFEVVTACSGIRSLMSLLALSAILGYFRLRTWYTRAALMTMALPVAVMVNIARVVLLILAFHYSNIDLAAEAIHQIYGHILFLIAFLPLVAFQVLLGRCER